MPIASNSNGETWVNVSCDEMLCNATLQLRHPTQQSTVDYHLETLNDPSTRVFRRRSRLRRRMMPLRATLS